MSEKLGVLADRLKDVKEAVQQSALIARDGLDTKRFFEESSEEKFSEVRQQLDSSNEKEKLLGLKRLWALICKGRDASIMFPDVVKNVACPHMEIRKLVYMFLIHYAEVEPQKALLSINSLQRAMLDPNQLLRASALRSMSSIRVKDIVQLIVLAVQKGMKDSSPWVRKTAALAIPKIMRLDPRQTEQCIELVGDILKDNHTMVMGAACHVWLEVCPDSFDLIHQCYRKICRVLPDIDEWGQVAVLRMLLRYGRVHFENPNAEVHQKPKKPKPEKEKGYSDEEEEEEEESDGELDGDEWTMDQDQRLALSSSAFLLQSRNSAVVLHTAILHYYLAPSNELTKPARALMRLLHSGREMQYCILATISTMAAECPGLFSDNVTTFFVSGGEPLLIRNLKLEVLTFLASEHNISRLLREFREYIKDEDKTFVANVIQAIGRVAMMLPEVAESCQRTLMQLMASPSQQVVAESVVVLKKLLQVRRDPTTQDGEEPSEAPEERQARDCRVIKNLARLLEKVEVPTARASIVWVAGEYCEQIPTRAPDMLRKLAKSFVDEDSIVKLQVLNLGVKLTLTLDDNEKVRRIMSHILQLAKYDISYDIRDRARMIRLMLFSGETKTSTLAASAKRLFLSEKPAPALRTAGEARHAYTLGTLSHVTNERVADYEPLPDFPEEKPDPSVRALPQDIALEEGEDEGLEGEDWGEDGDDGWMDEGEEEEEYEEDEEYEEEEDEEEEECEEEEEEEDDGWGDYEDEEEEYEEEEDAEEEEDGWGVVAAAPPAPRKTQVSKKPTKAASKQLEVKTSKPTKQANAVDDLLGLGSFEPLSSPATVMTSDPSVQQEERAANSLQSLTAELQESLLSK